MKCTTTHLSRLSEATCITNGCVLFVFIAFTRHVLGLCPCAMCTCAYIWATCYSRKEAILQAPSVQCMCGVYTLDLLCVPTYVSCVYGMMCSDVGLSFLCSVSP